ncbi:MAG: DMT family transporter [Anaerolineae bacterium]|nr:DMT family transporter [Anaerolineae bacterium]
MNYLGEIAALFTSVLWAVTSVFFTLAGHRVGPQVVNRVRLLIATGFLSITHLVWRGTLFPWNIGLGRWGWLTLSAVLGLVMGDGLLYYAFTQIGARLAMLLMSLSPVIGALFAWLFLHEVLRPLQLFAIAVTIGGVAWVVLERNTSVAQDDQPRHYLIGILAGIGAAVGQAMGLVLSKQGMMGNFPPLSASLIRVGAATLIIWLMASLQGQVRSSLTAQQDLRALRHTALGALFGPAIGMSLSLVAVQFSAVGVTSTLMALSPIFLLPLSARIFGERITPRAVFGTIITLIGVALLFLL